MTCFEHFRVKRSNKPAAKPKKTKGDDEESQKTLYSHPTPLVTSSSSRLPQIKRPKKDLSFIRCEKVVMESGREIMVFYPDKTMRNVFERMVFNAEE